MKCPHGYRTENCGLCNTDGDRIFHVFPTFGREHVTDKRCGCWCGPRIEFEDDGAIVIHEAEQ